MVSHHICIVALIFHAYVIIVDSINLVSSSMAHMDKKRKAHRTSHFRNDYEPPTMLLISSPMERKVSYTQVKQFQSVGGAVLPVIDAGLVAPYGIAWDAKRSALYVCDSALKKIFRVQLRAERCSEQCHGLEYQLKVHGDRYTIVEGVISQWVSVDDEGNMFFTDAETDSVNKVPVGVIERIVADEILPRELKRTSQPEAEGENAANHATGKVWQSPQAPSIFQLYERGASPNVGKPAGVATDGSELFWANQADGLTSGSVAGGKTTPKVEKPVGDDGDAAFPSVAIAKNIASAYGIAVTSSKVVYTDTTHTVWASSRGNRETLALTRSLTKPRGIVWDGDNTVYVADQDGNDIVSMPVGLLRENAPVSKTLDIHSPFGLALVSGADRVWNTLETPWSRACEAASFHIWVMSAVSAAICWH
jgi:hypothetical protein